MTDIVTQPADGDSTVRAMVADIINATWTQGMLSKEEYSAKVATAVNTYLANANAPKVFTSAAALPTIAEPGVNIPSDANVTDVMTLYDNRVMALIQELSDRFAGFRTTYFPDEANAYAAVEDWLQQAIVDGGLPNAVRAQIYEEARSRTLDDANRAVESALATFAARRFPVPPGAAVGAVSEIQQKAQGEIAAAARKMAELSVEMQKFNVDKLLALRSEAMDSSIKYITALTSGSEIASKVVGLGYDAQSKLISSAASFYSARTQAAEVVSKVSQYNISTQLEADVKNQMSEMSMIDAKLKALLAEAQGIAQIATSLMNNVHASVGISASRGAGVNYSYSNDTAVAGPAITDVG